MEYRGGAEERFGQGRERAMKFGDFLGELERKSDLFYLTTQVRCTEGACRGREGGGVVDLWQGTGGRGVPNIMHYRR